MNKVLVEIHIPAIGDHFDTFAPVDVPVKDVTRVIAGGVVEISNGRYVESGHEQLCMKSPVGLLDPNLTLQDYGVKDGIQLYLV